MPIYIKRGGAKPPSLRAKKSQVLHSKTCDFLFLNLDNLTQAGVKNIFTSVIFLYKMTIMEDIKK
jgi:hypothetical protein